MALTLIKLIPFSYRLLLLVTLFLFSSAIYSSTIIPDSNKIEPSVYFHYTSQNKQDKKLIESLRAHSVFKNITQFAHQNINLINNIVFHFVHPNEQASNVPTEEANNDDFNIFIPFSFFHQLHQGLLAKYPQQSKVRELIYTGAAEKSLWFEFGRALISQYGLAILGKEVFALDNFSTLMLLNLNFGNSDYILDSTEAYLLVDHSLSLMNANSYESELELDEHRYRMIVCLILGKDLPDESRNSAQPYIELLDELSWDKERLGQCAHHYKQKLHAWTEALKPYLKTDNQLKKWLETEGLSSEEVNAESVSIEKISIENTKKSIGKN